MSTAEKTAEGVEMRDGGRLLVWHALLYRAERIGIGEDALLKKANIARGELLTILRPLEEDGTVTSHLQQIGTGGTSERFYKIERKFRIMVEPV